MQNKNTLISFLQAFGIVLVVLGHSRQGAPEEPLWSVWLYTFHMPLFMFISGFLLRHTQERKGNRLADIPAGQFLRKKARRLLVPYVVLGTLAFVPKVLLSRFAVHPLYLSFSDYARMWVYPAENPIVQFWFLPTLFLIFLLVVVGTRFLKEVHHPDKHLFILVALLALHLFNPLREVRLFNLGSAVHHLFYFALGYYVCRYRLAERIDRHHGADTTEVALPASLVRSLLCHLSLLLVPTGRLPAGLSRTDACAVASGRRAGFLHRHLHSLVHPSLDEPPQAGTPGAMPGVDDRTIGLKNGNKAANSMKECPNT